MIRREVLWPIALVSVGVLGCGTSTGDDRQYGGSPEHDGGEGGETQDAQEPESGPDGGSLVDGNLGCTPKTCEELGADCGMIDDGCNQLIPCGECEIGKTCGAVIPNVCGSSCQPLTCQQIGASCGMQGDGCGDLIDCGACSSPASCGGTGIHNTCGIPGGDGGACSPMTCAALGADCGAISDGCGGIIDCGNCTSAGEVCGASMPNVCGGGQQTCTPSTCADLGASCGAASEGCGGIINCGTCTVPGEVCGGGGTPNVCGTTAACTPLTCAGAGANCGFIGDGCGGVLSCGTCGAGQVCGLIEPSACGTPGTCTPKTCADYGATCGPVPDGCGGVIASCGTCTAPQTCSGDPANPYQCGCTGVCNQLPSCPGGTTTTLTGRVTNPAGNTPLSRVLVYIPNNPQDPALDSFPSTLTCDQCGANAAGNPLVSTHTATDGSFSLSGVPVGSTITVVIQVGRWRRRFSVNIPNACQSNVATGTGEGGTPIQSGVLSMPRNSSQGDIPFTAIVTALGDNIECVFLKMGIDETEFKNPGGGGRIEIYNHSGRGPYDIALGGAFINYSTPDSYALVNHLQDYDQVVLPCPGTASVTGDPLLTQVSKLVDYVNAGGRLFTTHYSYIYLQRGGAANPFYGTALWSSSHAKQVSAVATIDTDPALNPKGTDFAAWLNGIGALSTVTPPTMTVGEARHDVQSVVAPTEQWMHYTHTGQSQPAPLHFTFNTPVGASGSDQCGRVVFSDFHVVDSPSSATWFPDECSSAPMTPQEKVLEYMLFDLASCVQPYTPGCTPLTCQDQGIACGPTTDGCGNVIDCGGCAAPETCGGGGQPGQCGASTCVPQSCASQGFTCGFAGDGCGDLIDCGTCIAPETCGGAGIPGQCGGATCTPRSCQQLGVECGPAGDGCGGVLQCGSCPSPETCGGGGILGVCGVATCTPATCASLGIECGLEGDGCGGVLDCGGCTAPETCGGGGTPGQCGAVTCVPSECGTRCGLQGDGCGGILTCSPCDGGGCEPLTCESAGAECGKLGDGCGGVIDCGVCPGGLSCGGSGVPYQCGGVR